MQTWMCKHDLGLVEVGMTDFFNDFDRFSDSSVVFQDFDRLSCLKVIFLGIWLIFLFGSDFPKIVIGFLISILFFNFFVRFSYFNLCFLWDVDMQTWMCKHDLGLVEVGMTDFFNDFDRFSDSSVVFQDFDRLSCLKVIFLGIWLIFLFGSDFPRL